MKKEEHIKKLIRENGYSIRSYATHIGIPYTTLTSMLDDNIGKAAFDSVIKICKGLGITVDELFSIEEQKTDYLLTAKEQELIVAYRNHPEMRLAVHRILGIAEQEKLL
ncbi:MAG: helix-turn-helix transcriptional regulator [Clostridiales bacterium]|nr:helix-turn-helix transcriptional regulator [Clostridiales bacterium]